MSLRGVKMCIIDISLQKDNTIVSVKLAQLKVIPEIVWVGHDAAPL